MNNLFAFFKFSFLNLFTLLVLLFSFQVAFATPTTPTSDFIDNNDGTVTHKITGLTWMRCALGQKWTGLTCSGVAKTYRYGYPNLTISFAGYSDWRLPNIAELQTIVERENAAPTINTTLFPSTPNNMFWSSSPDLRFPTSSWYVDFTYGGVDFGNGYRSNSLPVRLVRASQSLAIGLATPNTEFTDNQDGTLIHKRTGLQWQRCSVGQIWTGQQCSGAASTYTYDNAQKVTSSIAGFNDWRVPTANELASIVSYDRYGPSINSYLFPGTGAYTEYWSSSPDVGYFGHAWLVAIYDGSVYSSDRAYSNVVVRLVRNSQSPVIDPTPSTTIDLSTTITASTSTIKRNENITYTATLTNNGTTEASNATLIFYFPPRWTNYITVPTDCLSNGTSYRCTVPSLAAGTSVTKAITVNYAQRGALNIVALGITDSDDADATNNKAQVMTSITP